eukprot:g1688.t1
MTSLTAAQLATATAADEDLPHADAPLLRDQPRTRSQTADGGPATCSQPTLVMALVYTHTGASLHGSRRMGLILLASPILKALGIATEDQIEGLADAAVREEYGVTGSAAAKRPRRSPLLSKRSRAQDKAFTELLNDPSGNNEVTAACPDIIKVMRNHDLSGTWAHLHEKLCDLHRVLLATGASPEKINIVVDAASRGDRLAASLMFQLHQILHIMFTNMLSSAHGVASGVYAADVARIRKTTGGTTATYGLLAAPLPPRYCQRRRIRPHSQPRASPPPPPPRSRSNAMGAVVAVVAVAAGAASGVAAAALSLCRLPRVFKELLQAGTCPLAVVQSTAHNDCVGRRSRHLDIIERGGSSGGLPHELVGLEVSKRTVLGHHRSANEPEGRA